jgi:glycosyltransferase involved in cell wall biosynthesis
MLDSDRLMGEMFRIARIYLTTGTQSPHGRLLPASWGRSRRERRLFRFILHLARERPRYLDRAVLLEMALKISTSVELYGPGWEYHDWLKGYARGFIGPAEVLDVYRRTRINLSTNPHGFGLHSRTLECMSVGGFLLMHTSNNDCRPGGILTAFEPGVHFGAYTPDSFDEEARRWLRDDRRRREVGHRAAALVREKHTWRRRAEQILHDLDR